MRNVALLHNPVLEYRPDSSVPANITAVGERIASMLGGELKALDEAGDNPYFMPFAAVHEPLAAKVGISGSGDVYSGIVKEPEHADKGMLHEVPSDDSPHPAWYSRTFAQSLPGLVLPGFTTFSPEDAINAFELLQEQNLAARFKDPSNTGGLGQHPISTKEDLELLIGEHGEKLAAVGAVIEANLVEHRTVTIGRVDLDGQVYSWYGHPYFAYHNGRDRFAGNKITLVRGDPRELTQHASESEDRLAIGQSADFFERYDLLGSQITRATLDVVQGISSDGEFLSGVTDPSLRPSASSAAEIRAIEEFQARPSATTVTTRLTYDYSTENGAVPQPNQELFVAHRSVNVFTEVVDVT